MTLIFSISCYLVGVTLEEVVFYLRSELADQDVAVSGTLQVVIDVVSYLLPNLAVFDFSIEAAHGLAVTAERIFLSLGYAAGYIAILLLLASWIFSRREFN